ncbi:tyrosine-protein phosphatase [Pseudodonghicola xiamenensis]|uniref:Protein-tyrosine-phosphatase n=1 Tax=Pseudodonghicola xiamenensis TaxID=337702 RepID=A0A8J3MEJ9_9RHOB|nr:tyrosine-protein phosphatase [Pseudodonghicola xiamenensis]GHG97277.1 protein-tyrosine-phosphatase [Pseudodonghicola xiamenensis]
MTDLRHIPLAGCFNMRDLGGYPAGDGTTVWRRALRADSLHRVDADGLATLAGMGCTDVIDLRHAEEAGAQPNPVAAGHPTIRYHNVSLFGALDPTRTDLVEAEDALLLLYCEAMAVRAAEVIEVLRLLAAAPGTVVFHCTAGKDRTGIISALLLSLVGVARDDIVADYALTSRQAPAMFAALRREVEAAGQDFDVNAPLLASESPTMEAFLDHIDQTHGGAETFLLANGLTGAEIARIRARMLNETFIQGAA